MIVRSSTACKHCGLPVDNGHDQFCCTGCEAAHHFIEGEGLARFYRLRGKRGQPVTRAEERPDPALEKLIQDAGEGGILHVDVQGMHCSGCVWLLEELFHRRAEQGRIELNPTLGQATLHVQPGFDFAAYHDDLKALGYRLGPPGEVGTDKSDDLMMRIGVCSALALNAMFYAIAIYLGLEDGELRLFLDRLGYGAGALSVAVGGTVFFRAAFGALKRRAISLDLPIALGILLAFTGATWRFFTVGEAVYTDTITVFIALMLIGRWLQERALERNRRRLLADRGAAGLVTRRLEPLSGEDTAPVARLIPCSDIQEGDTLLIGRGDLVPVDMHFERSGSFSLDWIDGEQEPRNLAAKERVPAGAFSSNAGLMRGTAQSDFADSAVLRLLRRTRPEQEGESQFWKRISAVYVGLVLFAATGGALLWILRGEYETAMVVATAVLVVTCPCAFGIAAPLARELAHAHLWKQGLHVRTAGFLDRLVDIRHLVFDKTGTLTTGSLTVQSRAPLDALSDTHRAILAGLAQASLHPRSRALSALLPPSAPLEHAREIAGRGVEVKIDGQAYRLGAASWVAKAHEMAWPDGAPDVAFGLNGEPLMGVYMQEELRRGAKAELEWLQDRFDVTVLSGDQPQKVREVADLLEIARAFGGQSPDDKAAYIQAHDPEHTLMMGDGLNDHFALLAAHCAGTPAIDRPFVASRCDFYLTSAGLGPIRAAIQTADWLRKTQRMLFAIALGYNVFAVAIAWTGAMRPWLAAVLMPLSSLLTLAVVGVRSRTGLGSAEHGTKEGRDQSSINVRSRTSLHGSAESSPQNE